MKDNRETFLMNAHQKIIKIALINSKRLLLCLKIQVIKVKKFILFILILP